MCSTRFRRQHDLKRHKLLHTGERSHVCTGCRRIFSRLDALKRHRRAEGGQTCLRLQQITRHHQHHQQLNQQPDPHSHEKSDSLVPMPQPLSMQRPIVPALEIDCPASEPLPARYLPSPYSFVPLSSSSSSDSNTSNISTPANGSSSSVLPPLRQVTADHERSMDLEVIDHLRQQVEHWRAKAEQVHDIQSQLHDLQIEASKSSPSCPMSRATNMGVIGSEQALTVLDNAKYDRKPTKRRILITILINKSIQHVEIIIIETVYKGVYPVSPRSASSSPSLKHPWR